MISMLRVWRLYVRVLAGLRPLRRRCTCPWNAIGLLNRLFLIVLPSNNLCVIARNTRSSHSNFDAPPAKAEQICVCAFLANYDILIEWRGQIPLRGTQQLCKQLAQSHRGSRMIHFVGSRSQTVRSRLACVAFVSLIREKRKGKHLFCCFLSDLPEWPRESAPDTSESSQTAVLQCPVSHRNLIRNLTVLSVVIQLLYGPSNGTPK